MSYALVAQLPKAHAQSAGATTSQGMVSVTLESREPDVALGIHPEGDATRALRCAGSCTLALVPGTYRVSVSKGRESSSRRVVIRRPERLILSAPDRGTRNLGTGLAISGMVIGGAGSLLTLYGLATALPCAYAEGDGESNGSGCSKLNRTLLFAGLGGMAVGVAIGVPGLVLAVKNSRPGLEVEPLGTARSPAFYVGLGGGGRLTGLSVGARF